MATQPLFHPAMQFRSQAVHAPRRIRRPNLHKPKFAAPVRLALLIGLAIASWSPILLFV